MDRRFQKGVGAQMKICPKCNTGNGEKAIQCKDCGYFLNKVSVDSHKKYIEKITEIEETKHRRKMLIHNITLPIIGVVYIYFLVKSLQDEFSLSIIFAAILLPLLSYVQIHHPRALFVMKHIFTIDNIDDVELSDWYIFGS